MKLRACSKNIFADDFKSTGSERRESRSDTWREKKGSRGDEEGGKREEI